MTCSNLTSAGFAGCIEEIGWIDFKDSSKTTNTPKPKTSTCANFPQLVPQFFCCNPTIGKVLLHSYQMTVNVNKKTIRKKAFERISGYYLKNSGLCNLEQYSPANFVHPDGCGKNPLIEVNNIDLETLRHQSMCCLISAMLLIYSSGQHTASDSVGRYAAHLQTPSGCYHKTNSAVFQAYCG